MPTTLVAFATPPISLLDLGISLGFGVGQLAIGWLFIARGRRGQGQRPFASYALVLFGVWLIASGLAEVSVSALALCARLWRVPSPGVQDAVRQSADAGLLAISAALVILLALYPMWRRVMRHRVD
ncbi:MAG TPA: hypothetical protein VGN32_04240 [Ktedonobacterales bacterium]|nr:hypothetical protein [Ktedonobacterales bacterium]